jgi:hypothetical protein
MATRKTATILWGSVIGIMSGLLFFIVVAGLAVYDKAKINRDHPTFSRPGLSAKANQCAEIGRELSNIHVNLKSASFGWSVSRTVSFSASKVFWDCDICATIKDEKGSETRIHFDILERQSGRIRLSYVDGAEKFSLEDLDETLSLAEKSFGEYITWCESNKALIDKARVVYENAQKMSVLAQSIMSGLVQIRGLGEGFYFSKFDFSVTGGDGSVYGVMYAVSSRMPEVSITLPDGSKFSYGFDIGVGEDAAPWVKRLDVMIAAQKEVSDHMNAVWNDVRERISRDEAKKAEAEIEKYLKEESFACEVMSGKVKP